MKYMILKIIDGRLIITMNEHMTFMFKAKISKLFNHNSLRVLTDI